jgi:hypothetical protein
LGLIYGRLLNCIPWYPPIDRRAVFIGRRPTLPPHIHIAASDPATEERQAAGLLIQTDVGLITRNESRRLRGPRQHLGSLKETPPDRGALAAQIGAPMSSQNRWPMAAKVAPTRSLLLPTPLTVQTVFPRLLRIRQPSTKMQCRCPVPEGTSPRAAGGGPVRGHFWALRYRAPKSH